LYLLQFILIQYLFINVRA